MVSSFCLSAETKQFVALARGVDPFAARGDGGGDDGVRERRFVGPVRLDDVAGDVQTTTALDFEVTMMCASFFG